MHVVTGHAYLNPNLIWCGAPLDMLRLFTTAQHFLLKHVTQTSIPLQTSHNVNLRLLLMHYANNSKLSLLVHRSEVALLYMSL